MSVRRISYLGEPVLRAKARPVDEIDQAVIDLARDMVETMLEEPGLGLAAPQVGESRRIIVVRIDADEHEETEPRTVALINPVIIQASEEEVEGREGCLSLPTLQGIVPRAQEVLVAAVGLDGEEVRIEGEGLLARVLQHEIDHLDGVLFIDRADPESLVWLVPDEEEEEGYRRQPTTLEEVVERFERITRRRTAAGAGVDGG